MLGALAAIPPELLPSITISLDPHANLTAHDVIRHCAQHLEDFMVPKAVEFRAALPKTESGKISRRQVAAELEPAA